MSPPLGLGLSFGLQSLPLGLFGCGGCFCFPFGASSHGKLCEVGSPPL
jgi:hypothetical protein